MGFVSVISTDLHGFISKTFVFLWLQVQNLIGGYILFNLLFADADNFSHTLLYNTITALRYIQFLFKMKGDGNKKVHKIS